MLRDEEFREIEGFERYHIGNWGSVFSTIRSTRYLRWVVDDQPGYPYVQLMARGVSVSTRFYVHDLVACAFIPNPKNMPTVNHRNGIKRDNHWQNLEWATQSDQQEHALSMGLNKSFGETHYNAGLTWNDVDEIRLLASRGVMNKDIAAIFNQRRTNISRIVSWKNWNRRP